MRGFMLGLASGTVCLAYCSPVIVPYMLGEGQSIKSNYFGLAGFLMGRLAGYLVFAVIAWMIGLLITKHQAYLEIFLGLSYIILAVLLVYYCFGRLKNRCAVEHFKGIFSGFWASHRFFLPVSFGFFTGFNLCPPFLLAFTSATSGHTLGSALIFFSFFFLGTSVFFLPVPFIGIWKRNQVLTNVGKMAAGIIGSYYFLRGIMILIGGSSR